MPSSCPTAPPSFAPALQNTMVVNARQPSSVSRVPVLWSTPLWWWTISHCCPTWDQKRQCLRLQRLACSAGLSYLLWLLARVLSDTRSKRWHADKRWHPVTAAIRRRQQNCYRGTSFSHNGLGAVSCLGWADCGGDQEGSCLLQGVDQHFQRVAKPCQRRRTSFTSKGYSSSLYSRGRFGSGHFHTAETKDPGWMKSTWECSRWRLSPGSMSGGLASTQKQQ